MTMTRPSPRAMRHTVAALLSLAMAAPVAAQNQATPASTPTPTPLQRLNGYSLPPSSGATPRPTPGATPVPVPAPPVVALPTVQSTPTPAPTPIATPVPRVAPSRRPAVVATPAPSPTPAPTPGATANPAVEPAPAPVAPETTVAAPPTPVATPAAQPDLAAADQGSAWRWWLAALIVAALAFAAIMVGHRRRAATRIEAEPPVLVEPAPMPVNEPAPIAPMPLPPAVTPVGPATRASPAIDMVLRPGRAGLNLLSALVEGELVVTNHGPDAIDQVQIGVGLLSAHRGQDADLAAFFAAPPSRPAVPAFSLAPGESRAVRVVAATSRTAVQVMHAGNRPIFVPIVACLCRFVTQGDPYRAARAFAVGIERVDSAKLAPIWLDVPARMYDTVAARPHALPAGVV
ncbi:hypothetical protein [Sphingomonas oligophenolica]|uniref:Uncharacterized protein n=1 Tax=Sphingomonas oligophenolica TaxID=301154 RepID=A0A502CB27_9SPHN|nr:hypothetical protein [Sphingomonas oligophenolica]TPG09942.1 hypothetical protein EAH84_13230 [Sphingomonas oligophenolica]